MAGLSSFIYNTFLRRNVTMLGTVFVSAFAMQLAFDTASQRTWDSINKGRQWKDIKHAYIQKPEEDEDEE
ncbi:putative ubiquinol-cytochrome C reductase complex, subunit X [Trematosphaeria pertusa]|uniref:Complex III subunit 9 n=1 Tax=Trematosphaeria pertusa TaxID=390896 RepID=A0A6A6HRP0_9PLEO|nr:putative ubiquinol-cytochrome C reductase complex, subunit X [Trematosphaeria pertusa]KAF2240815.1 putative ubiquinol-cytochrome C reductase complex, subunit X [Trematosphaeria pertusa]